ncbi:MAG: hypothetical protein V3U13_03110 [Gemmatimonadota bacterium]
MSTTWRREIERARGTDGPIIHCTMSEAELDTEFDNGFGGSEGRPFTAWSERRVYFPIVYDGSEWSGSAPRDPCGEALEHQGGE